MKKNEVLDVIKKECELGSRKEAEAKIEELVELIDAVIESIPEPTYDEEKKRYVDESATLGKLKITKTHVDAREGVTNGVAWSKEAGTKIKVKIK